MRTDLRNLGRLPGSGIEFRLKDELDTNNYGKKVLYAKKEVRIEAQ